MWTKLASISAVTLVITLTAACAPEEEPPTTNPPSTQPPINVSKPPAPAPVSLLSSKQSACRQLGPEMDADGPVANLRLTLQGGDSLEIVHLGVEENCAARIATTVKVTPPSGTAPGTILVEETVTNPEQAADCICHFDLTAVVGGLAAGNYEVTALSPARQPSGPVPVTVPGAAPSTTLQSACKQQTAENGADTFAGYLKTTPVPAGLTIEHLDVEANCAAQLAMKVTVTPPAGGKSGSILVEEVVTNPGVSANCFCRFDLKTTVTLGAGRYDLTAIGPGGELAGPVTVLIP